MKNKNGTYIIGVDHGYGNIKTANCCFPTGVVASDTEPTFKQDLLVYGGRYFQIGIGHKEYAAEKIMDEDYYVLTLAAIARELAREQITSAAVFIAAGLPLSWVGSQKQAFKEYLLRNTEVKFTFRGRDYHIKMIFDMYGQQGMGYNAIAYRLNDLHIPARKGEWAQTSVVNILNNEVYLGKIRWRKEPVKRVVKDGMLAKKRILNEDYEIYEGRHEPIITQEQWDRVKAVQAKKNHNPVNTERQLQNPFAGILVCGKCGAIMKRNVPDKKRNPTPWYRCSRRGCDCKIVKCSTVETAIYDAMEEWLDNYTLQLKSDQPPKSDPIETELESVRGQLASLQAQQDTICEYLEKGIYTIDMFTKRNSTLSNDIRKLQATEASLLQQKSDGSRKDQMKDQIIPVTQQILDSYPILTPLEKNQLWKLVMKQATVYRSQDDVLTVHIYPNLPK